MVNNISDNYTKWLLDELVVGEMGLYHVSSDQSDIGRNGIRPSEFRPIGHWTKWD